MPYPATLNQPWWSYDIGLIHMIGMSTEHNYTNNSPQYNWLKKDLSKVNRTLTPWILFNGHRPMYINSDYYGRLTHCELFFFKHLRAVSFFLFFFVILLIRMYCVYECTMCSPVFKCIYVCVNKYVHKYLDEFFCTLILLFIIIEFILFYCIVHLQT